MEISIAWIILFVTPLFYSVYYFLKQKKEIKELGMKHEIELENLKHKHNLELEKQKKK